MHSSMPNNAFNCDCFYSIALYMCVCRHRTDVFDMARLRMPVRGPSARGTEPISSKGADDVMYRGKNWLANININLSSKDCNY